MTKIDLGVDRSKQFEGLSKPVGPPPSKRTDYPRFHYSGPQELDLPDEGEMTIKFRKVSETESKREDGSEWYECSIEVQCICECDGKDEVEPPSKRDTSAEDALDTLARALQKGRE